jgi:hypothetical protein
MTKKNTVQAQPGADLWKNSIPHWKDENMYPKKPEQLSLTQWRWEFLRRDAEYRKEWETYRDRKHPFSSLAIEGDSDDFDFDIPYYPQGNPKDEECWGDIWRILRKYGLARLLDPSVAEPKHLRFYFVPFAPDLEDNPQLRTLPIKAHSIPWKLQNPYLAWFDLSKPITPQLCHYSALLQREQAFAFQLLADRTRDPNTEPEKIKWDKIDENIPKPQSVIDAELVEILAQSGGIKLKWASSVSAVKRAKRPDEKQYPTWLRVLDARAKNVSWANIGKVVLRLDGDASSHARMAHKAAQKLWWKIPVERSLGPGIGGEEAKWEDSHSVLPSLQANKALLRDWLDKLPPRLARLMLSSLT